DHPFSSAFFRIFFDCLKYMFTPDTSKGWKNPIITDTINFIKDRLKDDPKNVFRHSQITKLVLLSL
ncbi:MAG: hypothetical protein ABI402_17465, partial [Ferruginibacter sp.]